MSESFKAVQLETEARAHVVVRSKNGKKLFDLYLPGVSVTLAIPADAEIRFDAKPTSSRTTLVRRGK